MSDDAPTFVCPECLDAYWVLGDTPEAREQALAEFKGCCSPTPLAATGPSAVTARATTSGAPDAATSAEPSPSIPEQATVEASAPDPAPTLLRRMFSGVPAHVRRRISVWPFDASDFTT